MNFFFNKKGTRGGTWKHLVHTHSPIFLIRTRNQRPFIESSESQSLEIDVGLGVLQCLMLGFGSPSPVSASGIEGSPASIKVPASLGMCGGSCRGVGSSYHLSSLTAAPSNRRGWFGNVHNQRARAGAMQKYYRPDGSCQS